jgi:predicted nucleotidyltransferase
VSGLTGQLHRELWERKMSEIKFIKVEKVEEELLKEIVNRILTVVNPVKIILFGSYAYGQPRKESDLDILVIVDNLDLTRRELRIKIRQALREFLIPMDILVATLHDIEEWSTVPQAFITSITKKGRVIYERENGDR